MSSRKIWQPKGQDLLEYVLLLPFTLILLMVIFDMGRVTFYYSTISNASREAARFGVVHPCDSTGVIAIAKDRAIGINPDDISFVITWNPADCDPTTPGSGTVTVSATFNFSPITPLVAALLGGGASLPLNSTTTMYLEL